MYQIHAIKNVKIYHYSTLKLFGGVAEGGFVGHQINNPILSNIDGVTKNYLPILNRDGEFLVEEKDVIKKEIDDEEYHLLKKVILLKHLNSYNPINPEFDN